MSFIYFLPIYKTIQISSIRDNILDTLIKDEGMRLCNIFTTSETMKYIDRNGKIRRIEEVYDKGKHLKKLKFNL